VPSRFEQTPAYGIDFFQQSHNPSITMDFGDKDDKNDEFISPQRETQSIERIVKRQEQPSIAVDDDDDGHLRRDTLASFDGIIEQHSSPPAATAVAYYSNDNEHRKDHQQQQQPTSGKRPDRFREVACFLSVCDITFLESGVFSCIFWQKKENEWTLSFGGGDKVETILRSLPLTSKNNSFVRSLSHERIWPMDGILVFRWRRGRRQRQSFQRRRRHRRQFFREHDTLSSSPLSRYWHASSPSSFDGWSLATGNDWIRLDIIIVDD